MEWLQTWKLKQTVRFQRIFREDVTLNNKGKQSTHFSVFWRYDNYAPNQRYEEFHNERLDIVTVSIVGECLALRKLWDIESSTMKG